MDIQLGRFRTVRRAYGIDEIALVPGGRTVDPAITDSSWSLGGITRAIVVPTHAGGGGGSGGHAHDDSDFAGVGHGGLQSPGLFAGQAAIIHLAAGTDILVKPRVAMIAPFGEAGAGIAGGARGAQFTQFKETLAEVRLFARNQ